MSEVNSQSIHVPPPTIPCGDQRAQDHTVAVGNEQAPRRPREQPLHIVKSVSGGCVLAPSMLPQLEDGRCLLKRAWTHDEITVGQAETIAARASIRQQTFYGGSRTLDRRPRPV